MVAWFCTLPEGLRQSIESECARQHPKGGDLIVIKPLRGWRPNRGYEAGVAAEERFFDICARYFAQGRFPSWYLGTLRGTVADDANGTDAKSRILVAVGDVRLVPIQIKSSEHGKRLFRRVAKWQHIPCIVVSTSYADEYIFDDLVHEVALIREKLLRRSKRR